MTKYRINLVQTVYESATLIIEAPNQETAEWLALDRANNGEDMEWEFADVAGDVEIVNAEIAP